MKKKKYWEMTAPELANATSAYEEQMVVARSRPLSDAEKKQWARAKRKRGRPRVGQGFERISVSIERGLLKRITALAVKRRVSRSGLFSQVLEQALGEERQNRRK